MQIDVNQTLYLRRSASSVYLAIAICLFLFGVSLMVALSDEADPRRYMGWGGVLLFGAALLSAASRLRNISTPLVTLAPQGIRSAQTGAKFVPWNAVERVSIKQSSRRRPDTLVIKLSGWDLEELSRTQDNPWGRPANPLPDVDELTIVPWDLGMKADDLLQTVSVYASAHGGKTS